MGSDWKEVSPLSDKKPKPRSSDGLSISGGWFVVAGIPVLIVEMLWAAATGILGASHTGTLMSGAIVGIGEMPRFAGAVIPASIGEKLGVGGVKLVYDDL